MNEIGYSDDPAEDDAWLSETIAYNKAVLAVLRDAGLSFPELEHLYPSVPVEDDRG